MPAEHRRYDIRNQHYLGEEGKLIPLLQQAQEQDGYITRERILKIHRESGIPITHIYGVATFYAQLRLKPVGKHLVRVCHGTACHVSGANDISKAAEDHLKIATGETTKDRLFTLETVSCLGCCSLAPVVMVGNSTYGNLAPKEVRRMLDRHLKESAAREAAAKEAAAKAMAAKGGGQ